MLEPRQDSRRGSEVALQCFHEQGAQGSPQKVTLPSSYLGGKLLIKTPTSFRSQSVDTVSGQNKILKQVLQSCSGIGDKSHRVKFHEVAGWQNAIPYAPSKIDKIARRTPLLGDLPRGIMGYGVDKNGRCLPKMVAGF